MRKFAAFAATASAVALAATVAAAAPKKTAAPASTPPIATYWMDVSTQSGMGAGMMGGGTPDMGAIMAMMSGRAPSYSHALDLRLASRTAAPGAPKADHFVPPAMQMGASLPLVTPTSPAPGKGEKYDRPEGFDKPKGRMLIYWGCGDRAGAGQPLTFDFADMMSGKVPENIRRMGTMMGRMQSHSRSGPTSAPGFGEWPNPRDKRTLPPASSLVGAHRVEGNYSPPIAFSLAAGQDFMAPMQMSDGGSLPSGAALVRWNPIPTATGFALMMFSANQAGDIVMWSSSRAAAFANLDYMTPGDVAREIKAGNVLPPSTTQCAIPADVASQVPAGMVMGIGYGPEAHFAEAPKNPKWAVTVRYKSNGSLMRGMAEMGGGMTGGMGSQQAPGQPQPKKKKRGFGLGDIINSIPR